MSSKRPPRPSGTPPQEGNPTHAEAAQNSPPSEGWQAKPDGVVPKLRFPEFRAAADWHSHILEELESLGWVELGRGEVISNQDIKAIPGDYPIYSSSVKNNGLMGLYGRFMFDEELISWSVDGGGDFFYRPPHKFSVTNVSGYMRLNTSHLNYRFTASQLQALHASLTFDYQFKAHPSVIRKLYRLAIPSPAEQQKIAECLSSVDEVIAAQARKVDALKTHKKGLMQQLFPREGETQPRLRFPEDKGVWEVKKLENLAQRASGHTPNKAHPEYYNGGIKWVSLADSRRLDNGLISETEIEISEQGIKNSSAVLHPAGTVLISRDAGIGKSAVMNSPMAVSQHFIVWRCDSKKLSNWFFYHLLQKMKPLFERVAVGSTIKTIGLPFFKELGVIIPPLPEQQRIATSLSTLDDLITAETQKLETLKTHKRGLMQQLFPSIGGVAGEA